MAKKYLFTLALCVFHVGSQPLFGHNNPITPEKTMQGTALCEAPPPDSFHMTSAGAHFVSLAWEPVWVGATHTLVVFEQADNSSSWEPLDTIQNVPGNSYTVENLKYGIKYKFAISTNCTNGEPSSLQAFTGPPFGLILDLILNGRTPNNPSTVPPCSVIAYENFDWVGFLVASGSNLGSAANYFEFAVGENGVPLIKRVSYGPHIVATDIDGNFPKLPQPTKIDLPTYFFLIKRVDGTLSATIGMLRVIYNPASNPKTVQICKVEPPFWASGYSFTVHTAQSANGMRPPNEGTERNDERSSLVEKILVVNPFSETLNIFPESDLTFPPLTNVCLINMTGQKVICQALDEMSSYQSISVSGLPAGPYLLLIDSPTGVKTIKVIKM